MKATTMDNTETAEWRRAVDKIQRKLDALDRLASYARHRLDCLPRSEKGCTCGLDEALHLVKGACHES